MIVITGGAGFIGSHLADLLLAKGHEEDILRADMARDLAQRVMLLLSRL